MSYETLQFYFDVEGGYLLGDEVIGHSFPTYTEPGSALKQPPLEHTEVLAALEESRKSGNVAQHTDGGHIDIAVEDNGPGLSIESQEQVFEAFYTTKPGGTGLGLAVTKTVLEAMGATIQASNHPSGARFTIHLPMEAVS